MYVNLSGKEMAAMLVLLDMGNSRSKFWDGYEDDNIPIIMCEEDVETSAECAAICDTLQYKLRIFIDQKTKQQI